MYLGILFSHLLFIHIQTPESIVDPILCQNQTSCDSCMDVSTDCRWCSKQEFNNKRCNTKEYLMKQGCDENLILNYPSYIMITNESKETQFYKITPGSASLHFRPYDKLMLEITVTITKYSPVETAIVMDFSRSMKGLFTQLINKVQEIAVNGFTKGITRLGVSKFVDKTSHPIIDFQKYNYTSSAKDNPFNFAIIYGLSNNSESLVNALKAQEISENIDMKEAILDAIVQTVTCNQMGWSDDPNVIRSIVAFTDDLPKIQGDARNVGVFRPHNLECHINPNNIDIYGMKYDYPTISQTGYILRKYKTEIIFGVSSMSKYYYEKISESWKGVKSVVYDIDFDQFDLLNLILDTRDKMNSKMEITSQLNNELLIIITPTCLNLTSNVCYDIKLNDTNIFIVSVENKKIIENDKIFNLHISSLSTIPINYKRINTCLCSNQTNAQPDCNNHGRMTCGKCQCDDGWGGKHCNCEKSSIDFSNSCKNPDTRTVCSGKGTCDTCGKCSCYTAEDGLAYEGDYCQCDRKFCKYYDDKICGGYERGSCVCNFCVCNTNYQGDACENSISDTDELLSNCTKAGDYVPCSGVGVCKYGNCSCPVNRDGNFCEKILIKIDCAYFESAAFCYVKTKIETEQKNCFTDMLELEYVESEIYQCTRINTDNCKVFFNFIQIKNDFYKIQVKPQILASDCVKPISIPLICGLVFAGIIFIGIIIILGYFLTLYFYYRADYKKFMKELSKQSTAQANPLFEKK